MEHSKIENQILFHGTLEIYGQLIRELGIQFIKRRGIAPDFGPGFYLTTNRAQAVKWAKQRADLPIPPPKQISENLRTQTFSDIDHVPVVLTFQIKDLKIWENLNHQYFSRANLDWQRYVWNFRNGIYSASQYDWVYGPVGDKGLRGSSYRSVRSIQGMDQLSIHTKQASELLTLAEVRRC